MPDIDLTGKTAVVTGGGRGIGKAIVDRFRDCGCDVLYTSRKGDDISNVIALDLTLEQSVLDFNQRMSELPSLDIFVNNAGIISPQSAWELDAQYLSKTMQTNLIGPTLVLSAVAQKMKKQKKGKIVNISSIASVVAKKKAAAYSSSKAGLIGLTRALAVDLADDGILVNAVSPGPTQTDMVDEFLSVEEKQKIINTIPLRKLATPADIANTVLFLSSDLNSYITGQNVVVDGGFTAM